MKKSNGFFSVVVVDNGTLWKDNIMQDLGAFS